MNVALLVEIAKELATKLRTNITVDWAVRDSVRAKLRLMVKTILRKFKYPPDQQADATELVLAQAESLAEVWAVKRVLLLAVIYREIWEQVVAG